MKIHLKPKDTWSLYPTDILFQTVFWSEVKMRLGWKTFAFDFAFHDARGDILVLLKDFNYNITGAYIQQGPEYAPHPEEYGLFLENLSEAMIRHLNKPVTFIRYDLPWDSQYTSRTGTISENYGGQVRPEPRLQELRMNFGTNSWNLRKAIIDMTVADAVIVDLGCTEEEILSNMKPKTRYNIRLARRKELKLCLLPQTCCRPSMIFIDRPLSAIIFIHAAMATSRPYSLRLLQRRIRQSYISFLQNTDAMY